MKKQAVPVLPMVVSFVVTLLACQSAWPQYIVAWGGNHYGELNVPQGYDFIAIAGGNNNGLAIKSDGSLVPWGIEASGEGNVPPGNDFIDIVASRGHCMTLRSDGSLVAWGANHYGQCDVPPGNDFVAVSSGIRHNMALKSDGSVVAWGANDWGQLNVPPENDFVAIAAGCYHNLALKSDGSLVAWGSNLFGESTVPAGNDFVAIEAGMHYSLALKSDGSLTAWGSESHPQLNIPQGNDFVAISGGFNHCLALKSDGSVVAWGMDRNGQCEVPDGNNFTAIAAGGYTSYALATPQPVIIYVDANAPGNNDGSSWTNAYNFLQDALTEANSIGLPAEIRVAEGIYKPDQDSAHPNGTGNRNATFHLINNVAIKGGYAGFGEPDPNARNVKAYETILSGDLAGNDVDFINPVDLYDHPTWSENSYHVVTGSVTNKSAVLDGFTITAGNANAVYQYDTNAVGGGMYNNQGRATVANCTFIHNLTLWNGGAMYNEGSNLTLTNCTFTENSSVGFNGAGIFNYESSPILTNCTFSNNIAYNNHCAGMYNRRYCSPTLTNCTFIGNKGDGMSNYFDSNATLTDCSFSGNTGCGMANWQSSPTLTGCRFDGNGQGGMANRSGSIPILTNCIITRNSSTRGAGMYNNNSSPILTNCIFSGNRAGDWAGGMYNRYLSSPILTNCTFIGNRAWRWGGGMYNNGLGGECNPILTNCTFADNLAGRYGGGILNQACRPTVTNCIVWSNLPEQIFDQYTSASSVTFSDVQDGWAGEGNIDAAPLFVEPGYWDPNGVWVDGDYRLRAGSPCIDAGMDAGVYEDIDGNIRPFDFPGVDNNGELPDFDMGAYEAIATTQGELIILPRTINRSRQRETISAVLRLPELIVRDDVDADELLVLYPGAIEAAGQSIIPSGKPAQSNVRIVVVFDKAELLSGVPNNGDVEVTIVGRFNTGEYFYGTDTVRIIGSRD